MDNFFGIFKKAFAAFMAFIATLMMLGPVTFSPVDAGNVKLNFSIIADTHIDEIWNDGGRSGILVKGLKDMAKAEIKSDALIIAGDMTEKGTINEYLKLGSVLNNYCKSDNLLLQMGNHDIRGIKDDEGESLLTYEYNAGKYFELLDKAAGINPEEIYFYKIIKGCYFVVLNPQWLEGMEACISAEQIAWLDSVLALAAPDGNPVFIINHQPLEAVGEDSAGIADVMQKYNGILDVFFISGHYHDGFSANSITNDGTLYFVDTPSFGKTNSGDYSKTGTGFHAELYEDIIIFRARDFTKGTWVTQYDRTIELIDDSAAA